MFVYTARMKKVNLRQLTDTTTFHMGEPIVRAAGREDAGMLTELVTRAARAFLDKPARSHPGETIRASQAGPPPAVFEESDTGLVRMVHKELVLRFAPKVTKKRRQQILKKHGLAVRSRNQFVRDQIVAYAKSSRKAGAAMLDVANDCAEMDEVSFATPNFISQFRRDQAPAIHKEQWHLYNRGLVPGQTKGEDVDARQAWKITMGKRSVTVAVLDDGVDVEHPNLKGNIRKNPDPAEPRDKCGRDFYIADDNDPDHFNPRPKLFRYPYHLMTGNDIHGTPCAGVIAATGAVDNVYGIAPKCRLLPVKIFHADALASDARVADAIRYAALHADVLSCSWGGPASADIELAIDDAGTLGRNGKGAAVFCASGNSGQAFVSYPAAYDNAIAVGASTDRARLASYSQYGDEQWIVAPSNGGKAGIYTTDVSYPNRGFNTGNAAAGGVDGLHTNDFGGTSSATPLAAGVAALVLSAKPSLDRDAVKQLLADTADKIGTGYNANGWSKRYGYGRVNAAKAVKAAKNL